jgi:hypothetical protein
VKTTSTIIKMRLITVIFFVIHANTVANTEWLPPYFKPGPREDVNILIGDPTGISMEEEIAFPIIIAIVDGYNGEQKPSIGSFTMGDNFVLGLDFELNDDNEWVINFAI